MFMLIFQSLRIEKTGQHKVVFWGIIGAVVFRGIFIFLGAHAQERFDWVSYVFGGLLVYAAYRAFREDPLKERESTIVAWLSRRFPVSDRSERTKFIEHQNGRLVATPLFIALMAVEATDILFAIDSVPAALSMTRNLFLVYSSNIFAILGLRALYLVLARTIADAEYLHLGLAVVLAFAGFKIVADPWVDIPPYVSVGFIVAVIWVAIWASLRKRRRTGVRPAVETEEV
jgi:tellurite resistance protein TerC